VRRVLASHGWKFAADSPLEERGFEPLVPLRLAYNGDAFQNTFRPPRAAQRRNTDPLRTYAQSPTVLAIASLINCGKSDRSHRSSK
jgi:hypothetical protein